MNSIVLQDLLYIALLIVLSIPLGRYMYLVMNGEKVFLSRVLGSVENGLYGIIGLKSDREMTAKQYTFAAIAFSVIGIIFLFALQMLQGFLPFNRRRCRA